MQAIIIGKNDQYIKTIKGTNTGGIFKYKEDQTDLVLFKIGGKTRKEEMDYDRTYMIGNVRTVFYRWDGKNLTQISFTAPKETSPTSDWAKEWKIGAYAEASVLKSPDQGLKDLIQWIAIFVLIAILIGAWYNSSQDYKSLSALVKPFQSVADTVSLQNAFEANQIMNLTKSYNNNLAFEKQLALRLGYANNSN